MAKRRYLDTVIRCAKMDPKIRVQTPYDVVGPVGLNCWIANKGVTKKCTDPSTGKPTTCFPYLHVESIGAFSKSRGSWAYPRYGKFRKK